MEVTEVSNGQPWGAEHLISSPESDTSKGRESHPVMLHLESDYRADSSAFPKEIHVTLQKMAFLWGNIFFLVSCIFLKSDEEQFTIHLFFFSSGQVKSLGHLFLSL